ncbi:E3 SUMO-protein ligase ZBED1-like [Hylaeus volcanicus]|uniref:E3 SUMO-protein ligase ZBED1-like n=1 Tax=Hylaeus volcanicus TaxID=313075 RepID=UPI0023B7A4E3|nr:E3 SUMO-protein ligase ZBED1-like [Hylaeus volcanicus]
MTGNTAFSFTTDGWTTRAVQSYMSLTVYYVTTDFELKNFMLSLEHVPEKHTFKYLQSMILNCLQSWHFDVTKYAFFTTDNGRNIAKAINTYSNWTRIPCFGHCLQLAIRSAMRNFTKYTELRKKCRAIVTFFSKSTTAKEKLVTVQKRINNDGTPLQLIQEVDTRWNSTYEMFARFLRLQESLNIILCEEGTPDNLNVEEWSFLQTVTLVLEPFKDATEDLSGELYPTISTYYPIYFALLHVLEELTGDSTVLNISNSLRNTLKERFQPIIENNYIYIFRMMLDPRFKDYLLDHAEKHEMHKMFSDRIALLENGNTFNRNIWRQQDDNLPSCRTSGTKKSKLLAFFDRTLGNPEMEVKSFTTRKNQEIREYFKESIVPRGTHIIDWWKQNQARFPILSQAARNCLSIPATQVKSERLFSTARNVVVQSRARLLPANVQELCFLHGNLK